MDKIDEIKSMEDKVVYVFACTNRQDDLDDAVVKRFNLRIMMENPDLGERFKMIKKQLNPCEITAEELMELAKMTEDCSFYGIKEMIGDILRENYVKDLKSENFRKAEDGTYFACKANEVGAEKRSVKTLPINSLRGAPLTFSALKERFKRPIKPANDQKEMRKNFNTKFGTALD